MSRKNGSIASAMAAGCLVVSSASGAGTPAAGLQGDWAGDHLRLVIDGQGGRVDGDCASGRFAGPVTTSASGRFSVQGTFDAHQGGPQRADLPPPAAGASYTGEVQDSSLKLTITPGAGGQPQVFMLQSGARIKLHRCL